MQKLFIEYLHTTFSIDLLFLYILFIHNVHHSQQIKAPQILY